MVEGGGFGSILSANAEVFLRNTSPGAGAIYHLRECGDISMEAFKESFGRNFRFLHILLFISAPAEVFQVEHHNKKPD